MRNNMIVLKETTVWKDNIPNHIYMVSDKKDQLFGYIIEGTEEPIYFDKYIPFYTKGRTFNILLRK